MLAIGSSRLPEWYRGRSTPWQRARGLPATLYRQPFRDQNSLRNIELTYARRIVGWRVSRTAHAGFVLDALEQPLLCIVPGSFTTATGAAQYVSIKYTERLAQAGGQPCVGIVGDSTDNALTETINGLYKAEVIHGRGPWRSNKAMEFATLEWVSWFNHRRLLEPIGNIPHMAA